MSKLAKYILVIMTLVVCLTPTSALAAGGVFNSVCSNGNGGANSTVCQDGSSTNNPLTGPNGNGLLQKVSMIIALIAGVAAVIVILLSGMSYITSGGDPAKVQKARDTLVGALVGLVIIVLAESIIGFVLGKV